MKWTLFQINKSHIPSISYIILGIALVFGVAMISGYIVLKDRIYPNTFIDNTDIGMLSLENGYTTLQKLVSQRYDQPITLRVNNTTFETTLTEAGITLLIDKTLQEAYQSKRKQSISSIFQSQTIQWQYTVDNNILQGLLSNNQVPALTTKKDAQITYTTDIEIIPEVYGQSIDYQQLAELLVSSPLKTPEIIDIPLITDTPTITQEFIKQNLSTLRTIVTPHRVFYGRDTWIISSEQITRWVEFHPDTDPIIALNASLVQQYISSLKEDILQIPQNAKITYNTQSNSIEIKTPSREGQSLMIEESTQKIISSILAETTKTELVVAVTSPAINSDSIETLGIKTLLGRGESNFVGSSKNRIANINVAANKVSGTLIAPGEEFSFVSTIGNVDARSGYYPELVIKGNKTIPEYGGGVCQVSTTLFRAALNASLPITERRNHSYIVSYYGTPGLDATIYLPKPDFRFKNNTQNHILIQHYIEGTKIYYEIYGTSEGKESKIIGPITLEAGSDGSRKTVAYREIYQNGTLLTKDTFYSTYRAPNKVNTNPLE